MTGGCDAVQGLKLAVSHYMVEFHGSLKVFSAMALIITAGRWWGGGWVKGVYMCAIGCWGDWFLREPSATFTNIPVLFTHIEYVVF